MFSQLAPQTLILWNSVIVALPPTLLAIGTLISSLRNGKKVDTVNVKAETASDLHASAALTLNDVKSDLLTLDGKVSVLQQTVGQLLKDHQLNCLNFKPR